MFSVKQRFTRGDLIEVYKMMNGIDNINVDDFFIMRGDNGNRGHRFTIAKQRCNTDIRKYSFAHRVVDK